MKCSKCGHEIPDGFLLCDKCGYEIQMVPDFEPEVEQSIEESLSNVAEDLITSDSPKEKGNESHKNLFVLGLGCVFLLALIILVVYYSITAYHKSSGYLLKQAKQEMQSGEYDLAITDLQAALNAGGDFEEIKFKIADCYLQKHESDSYINVLLDIMKNESISEDAQVQVYTKIIAFYDEKGQFEQINSLLLSCQNESIKEKYAKYMAAAPEFNYLEGAYNEIIPLKIFANTSGHIYYTMDGSTPSRSSTEYISPIFLETGDYVITAVFINDYGISSALSKATYHVDVSIPFAPEVDAYSGDFYTPQLIHAEAEEGCLIYYTTDDSEPTEQSTLYSGFLTMPLGKSTYKFVAIDANGISSEVTVRNYNLELLTEHTVKEGSDLIMQYLYGQGRVIGLDGQISEEDPRKLTYVFACCTTIEEEGDFYIYSEYLLNPDGSTEKTGNYYAVGIYNLPLYGTQYHAGTQNFALTTELLASGT